MGEAQKFIIKYRGILTEMYVTGFSEPMVVDGGDIERSVRATGRAADAKAFSADEIDDALALAQRCHPNAEKIAL